MTKSILRSKPILTPDFFQLLFYQHSPGKEGTTLPIGHYCRRFEWKYDLVDLYI